MQAPGLLSAISVERKSFQGPLPNAPFYSDACQARILLVTIANRPFSQRALSARLFYIVNHLIAFFVTSPGFSVQRALTGRLYSSIYQQPDFLQHVSSAELFCSVNEQSGLFPSCINCWAFLW